MTETQTPTPRRRLPLGGSLAVFVVAACLITGWFIGPSPASSAALEKHALTQLPKITSQNVAKKATYQQLEAWTVDNVRVKPIAVNVVNNAIAAATKQSGSAMVLQGGRLSPNRDPELFLSEEFTMRCRIQPSLEMAQAAIEDIRAAAQAGGKRILIYVAPSKSTTIGFLLGRRLNDLERCARSENAVIRQLAILYPDMIRIIDPKLVLAYSPKDPYWSGDSHWTALASRALGQRIIQDLANVSGSQAKALMEERLMPAPAVQYRGDLYRLTGSTKQTPSQRFKLKTGFGLSIIKGPLNTPRSEVYQWTAKSPLPGVTPSVTIVHDSFVGVPHVTEQFATLIPAGLDVNWVSGKSLDRLPVSKTVIFEVVDRSFLLKLHSMPGIDPNVEDNPQLASALAYLARP